MEITAVLNKDDTDMVEIWSSDGVGKYLACVMHIDNFTGPINDRFSYGQPVKLHVEIAQPKAYKMLELLADAGFDSLNSDQQESVIIAIENLLSEMSYNNWNYDATWGPAV